MGMPVGVNIVSGPLNSILLHGPTPCRMSKFSHSPDLQYRLSQTAHRDSILPNLLALGCHCENALGGRDIIPGRRINP